MPENNQTEANGGIHTDKNNEVSSAGLWLIVGVGVIAILIVAYVGTFYVNQYSERIRFVTVNSLSVLVAVAVAIQVYVNRRQWEAMQRQLDLMELQWKETRRGIESSEQSSIHAQRAYVVAKIEGLGPYDDQLQFDLRIENGGNTPANNVCVYYSTEMRKSPPWPIQSVEGPAEQHTFETRFDKTERLGVVAPNGGYFVITTVPPVPFPLVASTEYNRWETGGYKFYCWGTIEYDDIFGERRRTDFCFYQSRKYPHGYPCEHSNQAT